MAWTGLDADQLYLAITRVSAALAGAGAWDATPIELEAAHANYISFYFTYTRGGAAGAFDYRIQVTPYSLDAGVAAGAQVWSRLSVLDAGAVVAGVDAASLVQRDQVTYTTTGAAVEAFAIGPFELKGTIERIRIAARESGNVGTPGTLQIQALLR